MCSVNRLNKTPFCLSADPCLSGGSCTDDINTFYCTCLPGFTGPRCAAEVNECQSSPCKNGGTCTDYVNSYTCTCKPGFTGLHCETNIPDCTERWVYMFTWMKNYLLSILNLMNKRIRRVLTALVHACPAVLALMVERVWTRSTASPARAAPDSPASTASTRWTSATHNPASMEESVTMAWRHFTAPAPKDTPATAVRYTHYKPTAFITKT